MSTSTIDRSSEAQAAGLRALVEERYVRVTTFRRSGEPVATPMICVVHGGHLYAITRSSSGKAKRLRNDPRVRVVASTGRGRPTGPEVAGTARILERERGGEVDRVFARKYGLFWRIYNGVGRGRRPDTVLVRMDLDES
jgi:PPOX class probable F420-dependent enzyme